jgi:hypothetical protein
MDTNEYGVPQYPKGHTGRLLVALAAIDVLDRPTASTIAAFTGLQKTHIDNYVQKLNAELGTRIDKDGPVYRIAEWGVILNSEGVRALIRGKV